MVIKEKSFKEKLVKRTYTVLTVILAVYWTAIGGLFAIRWLRIKYVYPIDYKESVEKCSEMFSLDKFLIFAVIKVESDFDEKAVSTAGAKGLMQITDRTGAYIAKMLGVSDYDLLDGQTNIYFGCKYLRYLQDRFDNTYTALAAYNAGEGNVALWLMNSEYSEDGKTLKVVPFGETEEYLKKIQQTFSKYEKLYGNILDK